MSTPPLEPGKLAVRRDPRPLNPDGWAIVSNEPLPQWTGRLRVEGEEHAGLYAYPFKSWASAVRRANREGQRRAMVEKMHKSGAFRVHGVLL